jgi:hypothetical protein
MDRGAVAQEFRDGRDPGEPGRSATSRLLQQPLAPEVGGNVFHSGGRQFASKDDPNWKILADWVNGQKL